MDGKRAQVEALNQANLSVDEYRWVRGRAYAAIGLPVMDIDVGKLVTDFRTGGSGEDAVRYEGAVGPSGPAASPHPVPSRARDTLARRAGTTCRRTSRPMR